VTFGFILFKSKEPCSLCFNGWR